MQKNKSLKYLTFSLKLMSVFNSLQPFIKGEKIKGIFAGFSKTRGVTLLLEYKSWEEVLELIQKLKESNYYKEDHIVNRYSHAIILNLPINIDAFYEGKYSLIYNEEQIKYCSSQENKSVLLRTQEAYEGFVKDLETEYGTLSSETKEVIFNGEYDKSPNLKEEVLFYDI